MEFTTEELKLLMIALDLLKTCAEERLDAPEGTNDFIKRVMAKVANTLDAEEK